MNAHDFGQMFKESTVLVSSLLDTGYAYPRGMILKFAEADSEATRQMFHELYDETHSLAERVNAFQSASDALCSKHNDGTWKKHYQSTSAISVYLWLKYPEQYYIYRYSISHDIALALNFPAVPKRDGSVDSLLNSYQLYDELRNALCQNTSITQMIRNAIEAAPSGSYWPDSQYRIATIDLGFYMSRFYSGEESTAENEVGWFPSKSTYDPHISTQQWRELLNDASVFTQNALHIMECMLDCGGEATCKELSIKYGQDPSFYIFGSSNLAKRVVKKTGCPVMLYDNGNRCFWPVLYTGKSSDSAADGSYIWRLRDELYQALKSIDFPCISSTSTPTEDECNFILNPSQNELLANSPAPCQQYTKQDFLRDVYLDDKRYDVLVSLLLRKKNIILQGAPGVGKTFTAKRLAYAIMGEMDDSHIEFVQFHQNYSYEDFVLGYRPDGSGFKLAEGIFYRFCQAAKEHSDQKYFFLIDEINRGNLSKILGELMMLIENSHRGETVTLAYSGQPFTVPKNLYLIGMMNTADRSLAMIDYALRRRFSFFEMEPAFNSEGFQDYQSRLANETFDALIEQVNALNRAILTDASLGRGFRIGHSYFCLNHRADCTTDWMHAVVEFDLLPMLAEYWFDEPKKLQYWEEKLRGVFHDE